MTTSDQNGRLLDRDWTEDWESLAPVKLPNIRSEEGGLLILRIEREALDAVREVARQKKVPYRTLAQSWIVAALNRWTLPNLDVKSIGIDVSGNARLSVRLAARDLQRLKQLAYQPRVPYHRLARLWIYEALEGEGIRVIRL